MCYIEAFLSTIEEAMMKVAVAMLLVLGVLAGCSTSGKASNPESAQSQCKGTWDDRTQTCVGGATK